MKNIKKLFRSVFTGASASDTYVIIDDGSEDLKGKPIEDLPAPSKGYKEYVALLTQTGANSPVATVIVDDFNDIFLDYDSIGAYYAVSTGNQFTIGKTTCDLIPTDGYYVGVKQQSETIINIKTGDFSPTASANDKLDGATFNIRVYD